MGWTGGATVLWKPYAQLLQLIACNRHVVTLILKKVYTGETINIPAS